ncbi:hypothetical protein E4665_13635 [Sporolactobacillus shoreae]|uniref:Uncharacterized protein n=1 Tax=Sporolactobacillus shoreae TaxID=1465501 RepID=A0A4Z0GLI4_9BACL|nr:hypothetical protein [Sporolactobacillus shoreae]TGA96899.1 hypothetical protein E4665_13635 [Sporolactobacillus shoreae]
MKVKLITHISPPEFERDMNIWLSNIDGDLISIGFNTAHCGTKELYSVPIYKSVIDASDQIEET